MRISDWSSDVCSSDLFQSLVGEILAGGEAMDHAGERALPHFFGEDEGGILLRIARVDDQRKPGLARCGDMRPKAHLLTCAVAVVIVIIEAGLADRNDARMIGRARKSVG